MQGGFDLVDVNNRAFRPYELGRNNTCCFSFLELVLVAFAVEVYACINVGDI